jgi:aminoglycoside phosphotransferase (APT) family kinase protein
METLIDVIATTFLALRNGARNDVSGYAATIERILGSRAAPAVRRGVELDEVLAPIPRGFSHGDLWRENLVLANGQLVGIVDWVRAGDGRFPLGDLFHLMATERDLRGRHYGETITAELLPWARAGGDERARGLCRRLGFEPSAEILEALVLAYWYERTVSELESYRDRRRNARWMKANLAVMDEMAAG